MRYRYFAHGYLPLCGRTEATTIVIYNVRRKTYRQPCARNPCHAFQTDSPIGFFSNQYVTGIREPGVLTGMTAHDWSIVLEVFEAAQSSPGEGGLGHDDPKCPESIHYFTVHNIAWRTPRSEYGKWNGVRKRFWRLILVSPIEFLKSTGEFLNLGRTSALALIYLPEIVPLSRTLGMVGELLGAEHGLGEAPAGTKTLSLLKKLHGS